MQYISYTHFYSKKFQHFCVSLDVNFNESLTNDIVSFEQLGPYGQQNSHQTAWRRRLSRVFAGHTCQRYIFSCYGYYTISVSSPTQSGQLPRAKPHHANGIWCKRFLYRNDERRIQNGGRIAIWVWGATFQVRLVQNHVINTTQFTFHPSVCEVGTSVFESWHVHKCKYWCQPKIKKKKKKKENKSGIANSESQMRQLFLGNSSSHLRLHCSQRYLCRSAGLKRWMDVVATLCFHWVSIKWKMI